MPEKKKDMDPLKLSAQYAAFVWYADKKPEGRKSQDEAARFARENWLAFLPVAHEGWGRLLIKIVGGKPAYPTAVMKTRPPRISGLTG
jgi:hypothetical protein